MDPSEGVVEPATSDLQLPQYGRNQKEEEEEFKTISPLFDSTASTGHDEENNKTLALLSSDTTTFSLIDLRNNRILRILQFLCVLVSGIGIIYFLCIDYLFVAQEYFQVCFISSIVVVLDNTNLIIQNVGLIITAIVAMGWGTTYFITNTAGLENDFFIAAAIITSVMPLLFLGGFFCMTYVTTEISSPNIMKCVELDLVLYLISLTAICFFSTNEFNNNLHMLLDIRLMVMLYSGLYQEKDKFKLLRIPSFLVNMLLIIISFIFFALGFQLTQLLGNACYLVIGTNFLLEAKNKRRARR